MTDKLEQEPVAWMADDGSVCSKAFKMTCLAQKHSDRYTTPLYTSPPNAKDFATLEKAIRAAALMDILNKFNTAVDLAKSMGKTDGVYMGSAIPEQAYKTYVTFDRSIQEKRKAIQSLITEDDKNALRALVEKAVDESLLTSSAVLCQITGYLLKIPQVQRNEIVERVMKGE